MGVPDGTFEGGGSAERGTKPALPLILNLAPSCKMAEYASYALALALRAIV